MKNTISVRETAKRLGCTLKYVYDLLYEEKLRAGKLGRRWQVPVSTVNEYIRKRIGRNE